MPPKAFKMAFSTFTSYMILIDKKFSWLLWVGISFFLSCTDVARDNPYDSGGTNYMGDQLSSSSSDEPSSSSSLVASSSSVAASYSSSKSSSSEESPPLISSSSKTRSSSSKWYEDYPNLEEGAMGVKLGWATRYWDGCKPTCSWLVNNIDTKNPKPWNGICKNCDKNNKEVSTYRRHPDWSEWFAGYLSVPNSCDDPSGTYTCWDMAPIAANDTLAYGFAAINPELAECGTCYQLYFNGNWYDEPETPMPTHRALKGKTMIVMATNIGADVKNGQFDILIPGGGVGAFDSFSSQLGLATADMGPGFGGLLSSCIEGGLGQKATLEQWQECLRNECNRVFGSKAKELYNGCLWHADWLMVADNPSLYYKKVECPKYLKDKYYSSIDTAPPPLPDPYPISGLCTIEGSVDCKQTGWY